MLGQTLRWGYVFKWSSPGEAAGPNREGDIPDGEIRDVEFSDADEHVSRVLFPPGYLSVGHNCIFYLSFLDIEPRKISRKTQVGGHPSDILIFWRWGPLGGEHFPTLTPEGECSADEVTRSREPDALSRVLDANGVILFLLVILPRYDRVAI